MNEQPIADSLEGTMQARYRIMNRPGNSEHYYDSFAVATTAWERMAAQSITHTDVDAVLEQEWPAGSGQWVEMAGVQSEYYWRAERLLWDQYDNMPMEAM